ncbi:uncharacterized protein AC631_03657 [Debaryomyces fabryi]|uniref:AAA+ ATPase domain-containing protein n=1 Tax=Debaryomyces fabryi TaxID=58627 RepID=A0A0V1PWM1_9ASCO|nr:uncharacterized protein AC631_03657 [Debaryomyces fabryi]KSA00562.1 hypothetical protein AC631_03657 [Debaryomyces fabryi]CUM45897.1 unnamed protein product [Debaryomyces fabryi]
MVLFTCATCSTSQDEVEMSKHLSSTRHKKVTFDPLNEVIECEECEDSNIHQLLLLRFGLSDMALLCQLCLSKDEKPSTQYSLSNGSLLKKLEQYYKFRDIECQLCLSDDKLYVGNNKSNGDQLIVCKKCLPEVSNNQINFVSESDDKFLYELLGIKEFVSPSNAKKGKGRSRKIGRKGGKNFKGKTASKLNGKLVSKDAEERKAHFFNSKANSMAIKSGKTILAVGSNDTSPSPSKSNSRVSTPRPTTPVHSRPKQNTSKDKNINRKIPVPKNAKVTGDKPKDKHSSNKKTQNSSQNITAASRNNTRKNNDSNTPRLNNISKEIEGTKQVNSKKTEKDINRRTPESKNSDKKAKDKKKTETFLSEETNPDLSLLKKPVKKTQKLKNTSKTDDTGVSKDNKSSKQKSNEKANFHKSISKSDSKSIKLNEKKPEPSNNKKKLDKNNKPKEELLIIPSNIKKYEPSIEPKLSYDSMLSYFQEMSYNLFLEEKMSMHSNNNSYLESNEMTIEWYADQDKKHKQFKLNILLTDEIMNRFISKKMQSLKKSPFSLNQSVFLILGDEIPWYGQIVTSDTKSATKGRRGGLKVLEIVIELYKWNTQPLPHAVNVKWLKILPVSIPVSRVFIAMSRIENPKFINMILGKEPIKQIVFKNYLKFTKDTFNESQKVAIQSVLNNSITVLQGPPGSGKTSTIYEIILQLLDNLNTYPILVVAASNIAIDNIAEKLLAKHGRSILRIVSNEKEREYNREHPLASICLHHKVYDALPLAMKQTIDDMRRFNGPKVSQNQYKKLLTKQIELSDIFIAQAKVIFTTTVVAGGNQLKSVKKLPVVIMDEATQSSEPTTLIPLSVPGVDKFVFVGDQKQLSSFSQVPNLSLSLFERVLLNGTYRTPHMLDTQYRMHPMISEFPRNRFYGSLLKDGITAEDRILEGIPSNPVYFWDTCGAAPEERVKINFREDRGYTYSNKSEISYITKSVLKLIYDKGIPKSEIGIITPYRGQRDLISSILVKNDLINPEKDDIHVEVDRDDIYNESKPVTIHTVSDIMIASIDAFQGREKDFLIMSCVRSNKENNIGFLGDERRLNVALTRAKYGLIIIGDVHCLRESNPLWKEYLDHLQVHDSIHKDDEFLY